MEGIDIQELAREIAVRMDPDAAWDAADVGAFLKCSARYVLEEFAPQPDFPKAVRLVLKNGKKGHPKWPRKAIVAWWEKQQHGSTSHRGRPRQN